VTDNETVAATPLEDIHLPADALAQLNQVNVQDWIDNHAIDIGRDRWTSTLHEHGFDVVLVGDIIRRADVFALADHAGDSPVAALTLLWNALAWSRDTAAALREPIGLGGWFREAITAYDRPRAYSYRVVRSIPPLDHEGATLTFTPSADGTHVDWLTSYTHPAYAGGKLMEAISRPLLRWSFLAVLAGCAKALES